MKRLYQNIFYDKNGHAKVQGLSSPLFYVGLAIKLLLGAFFASPYLTDLFIPFINYAAANGGSYAHFSGTDVEFPYPALMEFVFYAPHKLLHIVGLLPQQLSIINLILFRVVCLFFDFGILLVLLRWLHAHHKKVLIYYWLSPILIYITYVHGQLDVVPISLLIIALYFLFKDKFIWSTVFIALAIGAKTSIALAVPFVLIYRFRYGIPNLKGLLKEVVIFLAILFAINWSVWSEPYAQMVYNNEVQRKVFGAFVGFMNQRIYLIIPGVLILLILRMANFKWVSRDMLLLFLAFAFGSLTLFITPMQGWYYWVVPFFVYFIIKFNGEAKWLFILLNVCFFLYFMVIPNSDFLGLLDWIGTAKKQSIFSHFKLTELHVNIVFTALQTILLAFLYMLNKKGIQIHLGKKLFSKPFLIGVSGDSGSGKTTLSSIITDLFGSINTTVIRGDDMHKWERGNENWKSITHLNPKANDLSQDVEHIKQLKDGYSIHRQHYDHDDGNFTLPFQIKSNRLVVFEGLHSFFLKTQGSLYDLKVYLDPDPDVLIERKLGRDTTERGKAKEDVLKQIEDRRLDSEKFIQSQKELSDVLIRQLKGNDHIEILIPNDIPLDGIFALLNNNTELEIIHEFAENRQSILFKGKVDKAIIERIAMEEFSLLPELGINNPIWKANDKGLVQLIVCACIFNRI